jgi:hypothetical protein
VPSSFPLSACWPQNKAGSSKIPSALINPAQVEKMGRDGGGLN